MASHGAIPTPAVDRTGRSSAFAVLPIRSPRMAPTTSRGRLVAPEPTVDPVTGSVEAPAPNREPRFVLGGRESAARAKLDAFVARTGRRPNVLVILMDDVGWGDFGCYGGGIAVGAPTPNVDRLARDGLLLTSCYSEPSCTPDAGVDHDRAPAHAPRPAHPTHVRHARRAAG